MEGWIEAAWAGDGCLHPWLRASPHCHGILPRAGPGTRTVGARPHHGHGPFRTDGLRWSRTGDIQSLGHTSGKSEQRTIRRLVAILKWNTAFCITAIPPLRSEVPTSPYSEPRGRARCDRAPYTAC